MISVIALSKLYNLQDPRLAAVQVKGDLIVPTSDRIMTRSRSKKQPDQYTFVSAQLKILKVLVDELLSSSGQRLDASAAAELEDDDDQDEEDGDWEDDPNGFQDLTTGMSKAQLMAFGAEDDATAARGRDDETQTYLLSFFKDQATKPGFANAFNQLSEEEKQKLRSMSDA